MASTLLFEVAFTSNENPVNVLTSAALTGAAAPSINISKKLLTDGTVTSVVSGGAMLYDSYTKTFFYLLANATPETHRYTGCATTTYATASPDSQHCIGIVVPDVLVSSRHEAGAAVAKSPATLDWSADVSNKPTIGTSTYAGGAVASVTGDIGGKVLGGGLSAITGTGAQVLVAGTLTSLDALWAKIQKWLRLMLRKDAFVVTDHATELAEINANTGTGVGTFASTTDSLEAQADATAGTIEVTATVAISAAQAATVATGSLALRTFYTFAQTIISTSTHDLSTAELILAIKQAETDTDAQALLLLSKSAGLTTLARAAYLTPAHGTLTVTGSAGAWSITFEVTAAALGLLDAYASGSYPAELKEQLAGDDWPLWSGEATITRGLVRDTA